MDRPRWRLRREERRSSCAGARDGPAILTAQKRIELGQQALTDGVQTERCRGVGDQGFGSRRETKQACHPARRWRIATRRAGVTCSSSIQASNPASCKAQVGAEHVLQWVGRHVWVVRTSRQEGDDQVPDVHVGRPTGAEQRLGGICELTVARFDRLRIAPVT